MNLPSAWNRFQRGSSSAAHSRSNSSACSARTCKTMVFTWLISALTTYVQEVGVDAKPIRPALLRVELGSHHVQLCGRRHRRRVGAATGSLSRRRRVRVHEVEVGTVGDPVPEWGPVGLLEAAP